jgi:hypothetical protein
LRRLVLLVALTSLVAAAAHRKKKLSAKEQQQIVDALGALNRPSPPVPDAWRVCATDADCVFRVFFCGDEVAFNRAFDAQFTALDRKACGTGGVLTIRRTPRCVAERCRLDVPKQAAPRDGGT